MLFDSHVHFDGLGDTAHVHDSIQRAIHTGVTKMLAVGGSSEANEFAIEIASRYPEYILSAVGFDRNEAVHLESVPSTRLKQSLFDIIEDARTKKVRVVAIGETGLDFYYNPDTASAQMRLFEIHVEAAKELNLPVIIHCRNAESEVLQILSKHSEPSANNKLHGVLHCCTGTIGFVRELIKLGYYIGLSGIITFKKADEIRKMVLEVPTEKILIETDSPYLAPEPHRGKTNESAFLVHIAEKVAELCGITLEGIAELTSANAEKLFGLSRLDKAHFQVET